MTAPSKATLRKYGMTAEDWRLMLESQNGLCPVCRNVHPKWVIDHQHVKGWKAMPPEERRKYVRGIIGIYCNRYFVAKNNADTANNVFEYLAASELRRRYS